ncbi:MAG TPA: 2Fe-2S iron-sulfur cluster-binding protein, partial [Kofleriaceae bacterium]
MQLTILPLEETIDAEPGETMLEACLRHGIWLPYACSHGRCGTCKVAVTEGEIDHGPASSFALMDFERADGKALACCATLKSDTTIEADVEDDEDAAHHPIREFTGRVLEIDMLTPTIKRIVLSAPDDFLFQAGQYVHLDIPGVGPR